MTLKIATWNVNSLTIRAQQVLDWLHAQNEAEKIDALALQELKLTDDKFPHALFEEAGYSAQCFGQKTYNGVAWLTRNSSISAVGEIEKNMPNFPDEQSRILAATLQTPLGSVRVINGYFVNGQAPGTEKFDYKMRWLEALHNWLREQLVQYPQLLLVGDFNITLDDRDSHDPDGLRETIHHTQAEREKLSHLLALGLSDTFRMFNPAPKHYSWWDYRDLAFRRNRGLRIDYVLASDALRPKVQDCLIDKAPRKNERPSDHTPVVCTLG